MKERMKEWRNGMKRMTERLHTPSIEGWGGCCSPIAPHRPLRGGGGLFFSETTNNFPPTPPYRRGLKDWMNECLIEWMNEWMNERMTDWVSEWMNEWTSEWLVTDWVSAWVSNEEWLSEWVSERMNNSVNTANEYIQLKHRNCQTHKRINEYLHACMS